MPQNPSGPTSRNTGQSGSYTANTTDSDEDQVQYQFDWDAGGTHDYSTWTSLINQSVETSVTNSWSSAGTYLVKVQARDEHGATSDWSDALTVTVRAPSGDDDDDSGGGGGDTGTTPTNTAPTADAGGPYSGAVGIPIIFNGSGSSDPEGSDLTYSWNFGDGTTGAAVSYTHLTLPTN